MLTFYRFRFGDDSYVGNYYFMLFVQFGEHAFMLKDSFLKYYIDFSSGYDPLFLEHYKSAKNRTISEDLVKNEHIDSLFSVNISYYYRLLRAQQKMLEYVSNA